jgi:hypothetical protein
MKLVEPMVLAARHGARARPLDDQCLGRAAAPPSGQPPQGRPQTPPSWSLPVALWSIAPSLPTGEFVSAKPRALSYTPRKIL